MTEKQARFVREYLVDLNATQAAVRAGYSPKTAKSQGNRLLTKADVKEAVREGMETRRERVEIRQDDVLRELRVIAMAPASDERDSELKVSSKLKALELLGRHLGLFDPPPQPGPEIRIQMIQADMDLSAFTDGELRRMLEETDGRE